MHNGDDLQASRRIELLEPVARMCAQAGVAFEAGVFHDRSGPTVRALLCVAEDNSWDVTITVVRANRTRGEHPADGHDLMRNARDGYDLNAAGEIAYQVMITEEDDGGGGGRRPLVRFRLSTSARAAADEMILWSRRGTLFQTAPPRPDPRRQERRERRCFDHREVAAAAPRIRVEGVPEEAAQDVAAIDEATLSWHFPRDHTGRYQRSAVLALVCCGGRRPYSRDRWLVARVEDDGLLLTSADLIGANQRHRWDVTPWLWDGRHAGTPTRERWQVERPEQIAPMVRAMWRGALAEALATAGVRVDEHISRLLAGRPNRNLRCAMTATWVNALYTGLAELAPWRLAAAHESWHAGRAALNLPEHRSVVLFGLGGMEQQRKPKLALERTEDGTPLLRLLFTGTNAVLPRALWTVPADLGAYLRGWRPSISPDAEGGFHHVRRQ